MTRGRFPAFCTSWSATGLSPSPRVRWKLRASHGKHRNPCTQYPSPQTHHTSRISRSDPRLSAVVRASTGGGSALVARPAGTVGGTAAAESWNLTSRHRRLCSGVLGVLTHIAMPCAFLPAEAAVLASGPWGCDTHGERQSIVAAVLGAAIAEAGRRKCGCEKSGAARVWV